MTLNEDEVNQAAKKAIEQVMSQEFIVHQDFIGDDFSPILDEVKALTGSEENIKAVLEKANEEARDYFNHYIKKAKDKDKDNKTVKS